MTSKLWPHFLCQGQGRRHHFDIFGFPKPHTATTPKISFLAPSAHFVAHTYIPAPACTIPLSEITLYSVSLKHPRHYLANRQTDEQTNKSIACYFMLPSVVTESKQSTAVSDDFVSIYFAAFFAAVVVWMNQMCPEADPTSHNSNDPRGHSLPFETQSLKDNWHKILTYSLAFYSSY